MTTETGKPMRALSFMVGEWELDYTLLRVDFSRTDRASEAHIGEVLSR